MAPWPGNPIDTRLRDLLASARRIAVVGLSDQPSRPSFGVARYLLRRGYEIIPVNPNLQQWNGIPAYPSLRDLPGPVDIVDVFRRSEYVDALVDDLPETGAKLFWLQEGVISLPAAERASELGLEVVMDRCILKEHARLLS